MLRSVAGSYGGLYSETPGISSSWILRESCIGQGGVESQLCEQRELPNTLIQLDSGFVLFIIHKDVWCVCVFAFYMA